MLSMCVPLMLDAAWSLAKSASEATRVGPVAVEVPVLVKVLEHIDYLPIGAEFLAQLT